MSNLRHKEGGGLDLESVTCNAEGRKKRYLTHPLTPA